jgi:hypothetical protein
MSYDIRQNGYERQNGPTEKVEAEQTGDAGAGQY